MHLDVESLRVFAAVLDTGGMTRAAEQLGLSQSAVSWKIKRLEERVGRPLLVREGRALRPSRDGEELLEYARTIVSVHDEAVARLTSSDLTGRIKLGATEEVSAAYMGEVLGRFNRVHPGVTIEITVDRTQRLNELLSSGGLDVALLQVEPEDLLDSDHCLWIDERQWISAPDWTYEEGVVPLVTFGETGFYRPVAERMLREAGIPFRVAFSGPSSASVLAAVDVGFGVAVVRARSVGEHVIEWPRAAGLPPLPPIHEVARVAPGSRSPIVAELLADLQDELGNDSEPD